MVTYHCLKQTLVEYVEWVYLRFYERLLDTATANTGHTNSDLADLALDDVVRQFRGVSRVLSNVFRRILASSSTTGRIMVGTVDSILCIHMMDQYSILSEVHIQITVMFARMCSVIYRNLTPHLSGTSHSVVSNRRRCRAYSIWPLKLLYMWFLSLKFIAVPSDYGAFFLKALFRLFDRLAPMSISQSHLKDAM